jgi:RNA polymerase sigma-70 factor, ECF subfamily
VVTTRNTQTAEAGGLPRYVETALAAQIPGLRRYARALMGNSHEVEDLVQECLLRALERVRCWDSIKNLRAYLFSILHNVHVDRMARRRRAGISVPLDSVLPQLESRPSQMARLELGDLDRALGQLPAAQRRVLLLVGLDGATYRETARLLDLPIGTVMSRLARGRDALRRAMGERKNGTVRPAGS